MVRRQIFFGGGGLRCFLARDQTSYDESEERGGRGERGREYKGGLSRTRKFSVKSFARIAHS